MKAVREARLMRLRYVRDGLERVSWPLTLLGVAALIASAHTTGRATVIALSIAVAGPMAGLTALALSVSVSQQIRWIEKVASAIDEPVENRYELLVHLRWQERRWSIMLAALISMGIVAVTCWAPQWIGGASDQVPIALASVAGTFLPLTLVSRSGVRREIAHLEAFFGVSA